MSMNRRNRGRDRGFTLIELMVALVLGLLVVGGVMAVFISTYQANAQNIKMVRLNEELRAVMSMMARDIRRAGVRQLAWQPSLLGTPNPFANNVNWVVTKFGSETARSCVTFAYDSDGDDALTNADRFGYRLNAGAVELRQAGAACTAGGWQNITDENVARILNLNFTATLEPGVSGVAVRTVIITLRGGTHTRSGAPAALTAADCTNIDVACRQMVEKIRLRNDAVL
jgi:prepilin peptidase dependent protein B